MNDKMLKRGKFMQARLALAALTVAAAALLASTASASAPTVSWSVKDMKTAVRAIGYPKPHPKTLACKGQGTATANLYTSFRCTATYPRHVRKRFVTAGRGEGGWLCAGKTMSACGLLRKGFITTATVTADGSLNAAADLAARGYLLNHGVQYTVIHFCQQTGSSTWSCPFQEATVTVTMKRATGGYVVSAVKS